MERVDDKLLRSIAERGLATSTQVSRIGWELIELFTAVSIGRSYCVRRFFNWRYHE